jgi:hypothetical protein
VDDPNTCTHLKHGYCTWEQKFCAMTQPTWSGELWCWMESRAPEQERADELAAQADFRRKELLEDGP